MKRILCIISLLINLSVTYATDDTLRVSFPERVVNFAEKVLDVLTVERQNWSFAVYPAASYSDRQGLAVGLMPMMQFRSERTQQPTTITPSFLISTNGMFEVQCDADIYFKGERSLITKAEFYYLPDKYYGFGNVDKDSALADYDISRYMLTADFLQRISHSSFKIGLTTDFTYHHFSNIETTESIAQLINKDSQWHNGLGLMLAFDNRDNVLYPHKGWYVRGSGICYGHYLGGRCNFSTFTLDARRYWALGIESVLAVQFYFSSATKQTPFHKMPTCGGTRLGRAIPHCYKYVDCNAWLMQCEARLPLYWRIGFTTYAGVGNVCHSLANDIFNKTHLMAGAGLRFKVFPEHGLNLRLDAGFSSRGDHAIYFNIREAF